MRGAGLHCAVTDFGWHKYTRLVDMGGAYGSFLAALLKQCPGARGVLFDQPQACSCICGGGPMAFQDMELSVFGVAV